MDLVLSSHFGILFTGVRFSLQKLSRSQEGQADQRQIPLPERLDCPLAEPAKPVYKRIAMSETYAESLCSGGCQRLGVYLLGSLLAHAAALWSIVPSVQPFAPRASPVVALHAVLREPIHSDDKRNVPIKEIPAEKTGSTVVPPKIAEDAQPLRTRPKFAEAPDFSRLEDLALPGATRLELRIRVSAQGKLAGIEILSTGPVPTDLLEGALELLGNARYRPAESAARPVAGEFDLTIEIQPTLGGDDQSFLGRGNATPSK
jgi:hypothetical protein